MAASEVKLTDKDGATIGYMDYETFMEDNPNDIAPECATRKSKNEKKRDIIDGSKANGYEYRFKNCIDLRDSIDVFKTMTLMNKLNNVQEDTTMLESCEQFHSFSKYISTAAILSWFFFPFFFTSISSTYEINNRWEENGEFYAIIFACSTSLFTWILIGLLSNILKTLYNSDIINTTSEQWAPLFPTCKVETRLIEGAGVNILISSLAFAIILGFINTVHTYQFYHNYYLPKLLENENEIEKNKLEK
jgi:hypothetical protein